MAEPLFKTSTSGLADQAARVEPGAGTQELGDLTSAQLVELLTRFAALDPMQTAASDPKVTVITRNRVRFSIGTQLGKLFVYDTRDASRTYVELSPAAVPDYLDHGVATAAVDAPAEQVEDPGAPRKPPRTGLALALMAVGVAAMIGSAAFTFRADPIDADTEYTTVSETEAATWRAQAAGSYVALDGPANRHALVVAPDGSVRYTDTNPDGTMADDITVSSTIARQVGGGPVFRTSIGPVGFKAPDQLVFARETYVRKR